MSEDIGSLYKTQIPQYEDAADIQAALKMYHYGSSGYDIANTDEDQLVSNSIAGYFNNIQNQLDNIDPIIVQSLAQSENLDTYLSNGIFSQDSNTDARSAGSSGYPTHGGQAFAGLLTVTNGDGIIYQTYQMAGDSSTSPIGPNKTFFRSYNPAVSSSLQKWSAWKELSDSSHNHNDIYFLKSEITTQISQAVQALQSSLQSLINLKAPIDSPTFTGTATFTGSAAFTGTTSGLTKASVGLANVDNTTDLLKPISTATQAALDQKTSKTYVDSGLANKPTSTSDNIFVQDPALGNPVGAVSGDLWFW